MDKETLVQKIEQLSDDMELLHRAVNGSETETVLLGGVATPSYRKLVADVDARESAAAKTEIAKGVAEAQRIADTAAQTVTEAASNAVGAATQQAERAKEYADAAQASIPDNLVERVASVEGENVQQNARLDAAEQDITALSTTLIGSVLSIMAAEGYVPNGTVPADAAEYTREQFREFYDTYLVGGKLLTCTYTAFAAQVALTGNCARFALDADAQKFKVPLLKDGDSITQALSTAELGKSVKAGLPNITGATDGASIQAGSLSGTVGTGALRFTVQDSSGGSPNAGYRRGLISIDASLNNAIYGNSTAVTDEQVRLRHFVVVASAQNSASVFDWSNYMAGLEGKANADLSNIDGAAKAVIKKTAKPVSLLGTRTTTGLWTITNVTPFVPIEIYLGVVAVDSYSAQIRTQGAAGLEITTLDWVLGSASGYMRPHMASLLPNASTVTVNVTQISAGVTLAAYQ